METCKLLMTIYSEKTKKFKERESEILARLAVLGESGKSEIFQAKLNSLGRKSEDAKATGDMKTVEKCVEEIASLRQELQDESAQVTILSSELEQLQKKISVAGREVLNEKLPEIHEASYKELGVVLDSHLETIAGIQEFGSLTGTLISQNLDLDRMNPMSWAAPKWLQKKFEDCF